MEIFTGLKPFINDQKGIIIHGSLRYCDEQYVVSGYLKKFYNIQGTYFYIVFENAIFESLTDQFTVDFIIFEIYTNNNIIYFSNTERFILVSSYNLYYIIYPSKLEIRIALTNTLKISANLMNKVMNYL